MAIEIRVPVPSQGSTEWDSQAGNRINRPALGKIDATTSEPQSLNRRLGACIRNPGILGS